MKFVVIAILGCDRTVCGLLHLLLWGKGDSLFVPGIRTLNIDRSVSLKGCDNSESQRSESHNPVDVFASYLPPLG